ncbi:MAG TPA: M48 family metallopeptidase [Bryobacteraceae bacterium]|nr:M48 family metallopeptidase [Bryobacteraceae bacterium]
MLATPTTQPVLVYNRIAKNRRTTWLLASLAFLLVVPFILGISFIVSLGIVARVSPHLHVNRSEMQWEAEYLENNTDISDETRAAIQRKLDEQQKKLKGQHAADSGLFTELMVVVSAGLLVVGGILFWGVASSPTSKLLVQVGAQPAGEREIEARRLLENLAIGAGLPWPKLYVIETSAPNAFTAGMDPHHAVVAVTRGALKLFDKRELEGVFAHELSHIGNHDIQLNTIVAMIALFLRVPYLLFKRELRQGSTRPSRRLGIWEIALSPIGIYILFIAPILGALLRAAVSREREFLADADGVLLTRYPEGLLRALGKIAGAGSLMTKANPAYAHLYFANPGGATQGWFTGNLMATHPPLSDRIERLSEFQGPTATAALKEAIEQGKDFTEQHPIVEVMELYPLAAQDELAVLNVGNPLGRVYRLLAHSPVPLYDQPTAGSLVQTYVQPGSLIVGFDDPGPYRQVNTPDQTFGYLDRSVKLQLLNDIVPDEVYNPKLRAAAESILPPLSVALATTVAKKAQTKPQGLTPEQLVVVSVFALLVFVGMFFLLTKLG